MRLTCHDCGSTIYITADAPNCPQCGADLASYLRALDYVRECYRQASEEALAGDNERALAILAQGLSAVNASELHLLAALIHRKLGEYDGMRRHVAAIPVTDPLRPEGEWLLRSHQQKQRAVRQAQKESSAPAQVGKAVRQLSPEFYTVPPTVDSPLHTRSRSGRRFWWVITPLVLLAAALVLLRQPLATGLTRLLAGRATPVVVQSQPVPTFTATIASRDLAVAPTIEPAQPATPASEPAAAPTPEAPAASPAPVAATSVAEKQAAPADVQPIASVNAALAAAVATAAAAKRFNLTDYLLQTERSDLAALPIKATLKDGRLVLTGVVTLVSQRLDLLALGAEIPGVVEVDAIGLAVHLPETYTVQDGDTLWTIAYYLYGDGTRWKELYTANEELLGNSLLLDVGMELQVPER